MITIGERKLTDAELAESYRSGTPVAAIAAAAGLNLSWTYRRLKRAGINIERPRLESPVPVEQLAQEYDEGASILILANRHGLYYKRVRTLLLEHGVTLRPSTKRTPDARG